MVTVADGRVQLRGLDLDVLEAREALDVQARVAAVKDEDARQAEDHDHQGEDAEGEGEEEL